MNDNNYDEYQVINRHKIAFRAFIITLVLVFLNGMISNTYDWAAPIIQAMIILMLSTGYFVTCAIFKNAYLSIKVKKPYVGVFSFAILGILNAALSFNSLARLGRAYLIHDGKLGDGIMPLLLGIYFLYLSAITLIKVILERRQNKDD